MSDAKTATADETLEQVAADIQFIHDRINNCDDAVALALACMQDLKLKLKRLQHERHSQVVRCRTEH